MYQRSLGSRQANALGILEPVIYSIFLGLAAIAVGIRLWSRKIQRHGLSINDYAVVLAWVWKSTLATVSMAG